MAEVRALPAPQKQLGAECCEHVPVATKHVSIAQQCVVLAASVAPSRYDAVVPGRSSATRAPSRYTAKVTSPAGSPPGSSAIRTLDPSSASPPIAGVRGP